MNEISVSEENVPPPRRPRRLRRFIRDVLARVGVRQWCVSLLLCDDEYARRLNKSYRSIDAPTDVLSFRQADAGGAFADHDAVGDIVVSLDSLRQNAREAGVSEDEELRRLLIHGVLHLTGMDHNEEDERDDMLALQERLLHDIPGRRLL